MLFSTFGAFCIVFQFVTKMVYNFGFDAATQHFKDNPVRMNALVNVYMFMVYGLGFRVRVPSQTYQTT